ncbi:MAG: M23 family metallopeptidase [Anaerolineae bacterium]|nr:M23 family metallopeptidase [Anaerolineae bacterium]
MRCLRYLVASIAMSLCLSLVFPAQAVAGGRQYLNPDEEGPDAQRQSSGTLDWLRCWPEQAGLSPNTVAATARFLRPDSLVTDIQLRLPTRLARTTLLGPGGPTVSTDALIDAGVPVWRTSALQDLVVPGESLQVVNGAGGCLPYPIRSVAMTAQPLVRGRTAALVIETDRLAFCHVRYLGQSERCYRDDATHLVVLIAVSALTEPGSYPLEVELVSGGKEVAFTLPIEVSAGSYGFQYIDPPPGLYGLMDAQLMASEAAYLARWRGGRSHSRLWELPLGLPLERQMSISADFGDRRSYGGMVDGYHSGIDYRAWTGLPVVSPADGVVVMVEALKTRGNAVLIDHGWGLVTGYWHLSKVHVQVGDVVTKGQRFAEVGNTGLSTGSHLHWEVWVNGVSVDGKQWLDAEGLSGIALQPYGGFNLQTQLTSPE